LSFVPVFANNITKIVALCQFVTIVASFYRHVTNIVAEIVTSVILSYHLVAVMWLSYVWRNNYIATLTSLSPFFVNMFCCHVTDMLVKLVTHCHCLVAICIWFADNVTKIVALCQFVAVCCIFLPSCN